MGAVLAALFLETRPKLGDYHSDVPLDAATRAELILDSFYSDLHKRHARERECLERKGGTVQTKKWNQQEVYLDIEKHAQAREASRRYLDRHPEWLEGPDKVGDVALHDLVAVQHYIDLDIEDLSLPANEKRNSDAFAGPDGNICEPFLQDAARCSSIAVDGRKFSFHSRCSRHGITAQKNPEEVRKLRQAFMDDLANAVVKSLSKKGQANPLLVRAVTSAMSQSGLASVERACYSSQVIVSGGEQNVRYKLVAREDDCWDVTLSVKKVSFDQCIICSQFFEDPATVPCNPKSSVSKACTIRFSAPAGTNSIRADVIKLRKEMCLVNVYGSLVTGHALRPHSPAERDRSTISEEAPAGKGDDESTDTGGDEEDFGPETT